MESPFKGIRSAALRVKNITVAEIPFSFSLATIFADSILFPSRIAPRVSVVVRINDRGPAAWTGRSLDLSYGAARKLGLTLMALVHISMDRHTPERFANFEASVGVLPEVLECLLITGQDADYQLKVAIRDMDHYQSLLLEKITRIVGVTGVHSSFVLRRVVNKTALPLG